MAAVTVLPLRTLQSPDAGMAHVDGRVHLLACYCVGRMLLMSAAEIEAHA